MPRLLSIIVIVSLSGMKVDWLKELANCSVDGVRGLKVYGCVLVFIPWVHKENDLALPDMARIRCGRNRWMSLRIFMAQFQC